MSLYTKVYSAVTGRSSKWPALRKAIIRAQPYCSLCKGTAKLEAHHIKPFHLFPDLELEPTNLIVLCESKKHGVNCHLFFGHLGDFKNWNASVVKDAEEWSAKLT